MISYHLPQSLEKDISNLEELIRKYRKGEIGAAELKAHRVPFGVYEQRDPDTYMVRIRCAGGAVTPFQLEKISEISSRYGTNQIHLTTRQEIQLHYIKLDDLIFVIKALKEIGLASRGGGGNTVRNIIAQEDSGIDPKEVFDVAPYAISLTTRLIAETDSWTLPRKFKIAFSTSAEDKAYATVTDVGFIAVVKDGKKGFKVYVAGGLGAKSSVGNLLFDFIPEQEVYNVVRAVKLLFWKYGNRKNKHAARLRFLWASLGKEEFEKRFKEEYAAVKKEKHSPLEVEEAGHVVPEIDLPEEGIDDGVDFNLWKARYVRPQKQEGLFSIIVPIELGFVDNERVLKLTQFLRTFGDDVIRMAKEQNFMVRNIPEKYLVNAYNCLKKVMDGFNRPFVFDKMISCAGASTCQLGLCLSRGAAKALMRMFEKSGLDLDKLADLKINISGCPNACGQHPNSHLGFFGKAGRKNERLYPAYNVVAGAVIYDGKTKHAEKVGEVCARDVPKLVEEFFGLYLAKVDDYKDIRDYIQRDGKRRLGELCAKYLEPPDFEDDTNYYFDWGSDKVFSMAGRGSGECAAGLFDLIEVDLNNILDIRKKIADISSTNKKEDMKVRQRYLKDIVFYASRMLLIVRAVEVKTEKEVYDNFSKYFIETGLAPSFFKDVLKAAEDRDYQTLFEKEETVFELGDRVKFLYDNMDNAFQFQVPEASHSVADKQSISPQSDKASSAKDIKPKLVKDFRGTPCPMNFVKTKAVLFSMESKDILEILLDDGEPIENVPGSVKEEGHKIVKQEKVDDYWTVFIEKR